jgi:rSAM/selenodomain-associated transferase 1
MSTVEPLGVAMIVIAKEPVPGRCKTRMCPPLTEVEAAALAEAALADTLATVAATPARRRLLALSGRAGPWLPAGFEVVAQPAGGLDLRLAAAFAAAGGPALLVGMDTPQLTVADLRAGAEALGRDGVDAVLGGAEDGGYWSVGLRRPLDDALRGVPMSSPLTAREQRRRFTCLGLNWAELEPRRDVDTFEDACAVAQACPDSRFARTLEAIRWPAAA